MINYKQSDPAKLTPLMTYEMKNAFVLIFWNLNTEIGKAFKINQYVLLTLYVNKIKK